MKRKILTVVGARPQIIKASAVSRCIAANFSDQLEEVIIHTGQHYDDDMSQVFFDELRLPAPKFHLGIGEATLECPTAAMMAKLRKIFELEKPTAILVYGDTNSTLAAALEASFLAIPLIHIEAGLRSFNKNMPEEINRILTDHMSTMLFAPTSTALANLEREGFAIHNTQTVNRDHPAVQHCGDIMLDNALFFRKIAMANVGILSGLNISAGNFFLATVHRGFNTDDPEKLSAIMEALIRIGTDARMPVILPLHPRTAKMLNLPDLVELMSRLLTTPFIRMMGPVSYLDMIVLESNAALIFTDSGGVQKEAFFFQKPCVILRPQTEWVELVENGNAIIADTDPDKIFKAYKYFMGEIQLSWPPIFGNGKAAIAICRQIMATI